jgi:hypothetical protein
MSKNSYYLLFLISITWLTSLSNCDPTNHSPSDHPCNFPDIDTENNLRSPWSFKILKNGTFENMVGVTKNLIHPDSVKLYDKNLIEIDPKPRLRFDNEWTFDNFPPYINVPFNDPKALLDLDEEVFYLKTNFEDIDTISVSFNSCLIMNVLFNGRLTERPASVNSSASFYFIK